MYLEASTWTRGQGCGRKGGRSPAPLPGSCRLKGQKAGNRAGAAILREPMVPRPGELCRVVRTAWPEHAWPGGLGDLGRMTFVSTAVASRPGQDLLGEPAGLSSRTSIPVALNQLTSSQGTEF